MPKNQKTKAIMIVAIWFGVGLSSLAIGLGGACFLSIFAIVATLELYSL